MKNINLVVALALAFVLNLETAQAAPEVATKELQAGVVSVDITPEIGVPLAGYGAKDRRLKHYDWDNTHPYSFFFKPTVGVHTAIRSKVMVLQKEKKHLVFISLDMIGVEKRFVDDLADALAPFGIKKEELVVTGTHTHSGPGTLSRTLPLELIATDLFIKSNYEFVLRKVEQSVIVALNQLEPVELFKSSFIADKIQVNKFRFKDQEHYNKTASFLLARSKSNGQWLGGLVNFAIHGGGMPVPLMLYSSDFPGQVELHLEAKLRTLNGQSFHLPTMLFMNGAEGDVGVPGRGVALIEDLGAEFSRQADAAFTPAALTPVSPEFSIDRRQVWMGVPGSSLKYCVGGMFKKSPIPLRIPLLGLMTAHSYLSLIQVGDITMMSWPGEASTTLGFTLQDVARKYGHNDPWVLGLTNDYTAYYTTKSEFSEGVYDSCSSLYGWRGGKRIIRKYEKMLKAPKN